MVADAGEGRRADRLTTTPTRLEQAGRVRNPARLQRQLDLRDELLLELLEEPVAVDLADADSVADLADSLAALAVWLA